MSPLRSNCEDVLDLGAGAIAIVRECLDDDRDAPGCVTLVRDGFVPHPLEFAGAALDGAFNGVDRHRGLARLLEHRAQARVRRRVASAFACRHLDLANQFGKYLRTGAVFRALSMLGRRPLRMAGHFASCPLGLFHRTAI